MSKTAGRPAKATVLILLGPPGAGKGTHARRLQDRFGLLPLSTGDLLRAAVADGTVAGKAAAAAMQAGALVQDEIIVAILQDRLHQPDIRTGIILDGFPRTSSQAMALDGLLASVNLTVSAVVSLEVDPAAIVARITGRHSCAGCGEGYHDSFKPTVRPGVCDACGGSDFKRRDDDNATTVTARLAAYSAETAPLIGHYQRMGKLHAVPAMGRIDDIAQTLTDIVSGLEP